MFIQLENKKLINAEYVVTIFIPTDTTVPSVCCKCTNGDSVILYEGNTIKQCNRKLNFISDEIKADSKIIEIGDNDYEEHYIDIVAVNGGSEIDKRIDTFRYSIKEPQLLIDMFELSTLGTNNTTGYFTRKETTYGIINKSSGKIYACSHNMHRMEKLFNIFKSKIIEQYPTINFDYIISRM